MKKYICICGKKFTSSQSYNGHKTHCQIHQSNKHGDLTVYNSSQQLFRQKGMIARQNKLAKQKEQKLENWISEQHKCERCGKIMTEYYGSGRFCSKKCANSRPQSQESIKKISNSLSKNIQLPSCKLCGKTIRQNNKTGYCSKCLHTSIDLAKYRSRLAKYASSHVKSHKYWEPRNQASYAEKFWIQVLNNNNISFIHDKTIHINSKHRYYLDFYIEINNKKLDLEIDGKQHDYPERKQHDQIRDKFLKDNGFIVYRIKWNEINSENGKELMKNKIDEFLKFYRTLA